MFSKVKKYYKSNEVVFHIVLFALIVFAGAFVRFYDLQNNPPALNQDEAINGYDAYSIGNTGKDHHGAVQPQPMLQSFSDWSSPLITYITIPFVKAFGLSEFSVRLPVAILGVLSIFLFYLLVYQLFKNKSLALFGALVWGLSPWYISISRWAIPPSIIPFFLLLFLVAMFWALDSLNIKKTKSKKFELDWKIIGKFVLAGLAAGILTYSYPTMKVFVPLFVGAICLIYLVKDRKNFWNLFAMGLTTLIFIAPIFYLTLKEPEKYNARLSSVSLFGSGENVIVGFIIRYLEYFTPIYAFGFGDPNKMHKVPGFSSLPEFLAPLFYVGVAVVIYRLFRLKKDYLLSKNYLYILLAGLLLFPVAAAITREHFMQLRTLHGYAFIVIFILIGGVFLLDYIQNQKAKLLTIVISVMLIIFQFAAFSVYYFNYYPQTVQSSFNYGLKETFEYVNKNKDKYNLILIDNDILQIYYLFYSKYDSNLLHPKPEEEKFNVYDDGKVQFRILCDEDFIGAKRIKKIDDYDHAWFSIYKNGDVLIIDRVNTYKPVRI